MQELFNKKIEEAMHSIDDMDKASLSPYFFTRLEARMQKQKNVWEKAFSFATRPSITIPCICLILTINAVVIFSSAGKENGVSPQNSELATVDEYTEVTTTLYDLENIKP